MKKENKDKSNLQDSFYEDIFQNAPIGIYTINKDGIIDSLNPSMLKIIGAKNPSEVLGLNTLELSSYKKSGLSEIFSKSLVGGAPFTVDKVHYTSYTAGKKTVRNYKGVPIKTNDGTVTHLLLMVEDLTEEDRLYRQLNGLIDNLPEGILIEDENRKITYVNQEFCKLFGINIPPSALIGSDCYQASLQLVSLWSLPQGPCRKVRKPSVF